MDWVCAEVTLYESGEWGGVMQRLQFGGRSQACSRGSATARTFVETSPAGLGCGGRRRGALTLALDLTLRPAWLALQRGRNHEATVDCSSSAPRPYTRHAQLLGLCKNGHDRVTACAQVRT